MSLLSLEEEGFTIRYGFWLHASFAAQQTTNSGLVKNEN